MKYRQLTDDQRTQFVDTDHLRAFASCSRPILVKQYDQKGSVPVVVKVKKRRRAPA